MSEREVPEEIVLDEGEEEPQLQENGSQRKEKTVPDEQDNDGGYSRTLKRLRARHHYIIRLMATGQFKQKEVAEIVGVTAQTVSNTMNTELAQQKLEHLQSQADASIIDIFEELENMAPMAVAQLQEILTDPGTKQRLKLKAAKEILDRAGYGKSKNVNMRHETVDDNDIREIKEKAKRRAKAEGSLEEANVIDSDEQ